MMRYCAMNPTNTPRGVCSTALKLPTLSVMPMPSMITASPHVMKSPLNQVNQAGCHNASPPPSKTQPGKRLVSRDKARFMREGLKGILDQAQSVSLIRAAFLRWLLAATGHGFEGVEQSAQFKGLPQH